MIEEALLNYGVLGLWTLTLIFEKYKWQRGLTIALTDLTQAIKKKVL